MKEKVATNDQGQNAEFGMIAQDNQANFDFCSDATYESKDRNESQEKLKDISEDKDIVKYN